MMRWIGIVLALALLSSFSSAEWKFNENSLNGCICYYSCGILGGWDCASVSCGYNPKPSDASPACQDLGGGPCMCSGWGCGRTQMLKAGRLYENCLAQHAKPVCGDGNCENNKDETCSTCPKDCGCFSTAECTGKDPKDNRGCTDKCAGIDCKPKCDGNTLSTAGKCNRDTKSCDYKVVSCKSGCDQYSGRCKDEDDKCRGVVCEGECGYDGVIKSDGKCDPKTGQCKYEKNATCPKGCADKDKCRGYVDGVVYYTDTTNVPAGVKEPMRQVKVKMRYIDKDGKMHEGKGPDDPEFFVWTDEQGRFAWTYSDNFEPEGKVSLAIRFENQKKKLHLVEYDKLNDILGIYYEKNLPITDPKLKYYDVDLIKTPLAGNQLLAENGKIYANVLKAIEFKENALFKGDTVEERIMVYKPDGGAWHLAEVWKDTEPDTGMNVPSTRSAFGNPAAPCNREFHEYGHHIMGEWINKKINHPGGDHDGYPANPNSEYGLVEGWAEFCGLTMKQAYGLGANGDYEVDNTHWNLEANYRIRGQGTNTEELSIAGLLWDLADSYSNYPGGADDDQISMWPFQVYNAMATKYDFGDGAGARLPLTVRDLYLALNATGPYQLRDPYPGQNYSKLDQIFLIHGIFQDANSNLKWDEGEPFGYSGRGAPKRTDLTNEPGTEIDFDVKDQRGNPIPNLYARMTVNYSAPYSHLSDTYMIPVVDGVAAVAMPPDDYNATITMEAVQGGTNNTAKQKFTITTKELYKKLNPKNHLGTISGTIKTTAVPCKLDTECMYALAGTRCDNRTSTCVGDAGLKKFDNPGCGNGMRCEGEPESILGGAGGSLPCCSFLPLLPLIVAAAAAAGKNLIL